MSKEVAVIDLAQDGTEHLRYNCPGCMCYHAVPVKPMNSTEDKRWAFNGDLKKPTLTPSVLHRTGKYVDPEYDDELGLSSICHYFLTDGVLHFCSDSTHQYKGQSIPLL